MTSFHFHGFPIKLCVECELSVRREIACADTSMFESMCLLVPYHIDLICRIVDRQICTQVFFPLIFEERSLFMLNTYRLIELRMPQIFHGSDDLLRPNCLDFCLDAISMPISYTYITNRNQMISILYFNVSIQ